MDKTKLKISEEVSMDSCESELSLMLESKEAELTEQRLVSLETEIPEVLYRGMKEFICANPQWDQYHLMSSALANFLFQNGSQDRVVVEKYLNDLFTLSDS